MKFSKYIIAGVVFLVVIWHIIIAMTISVKVSGLLLAKPADPGFVWINADNTDSRFFWQITGVKWLAGIRHPDFNVETSATKGVWEPLPGYAFINKTKGLETRWEAGLLHPDYMAWSDDVENKWIPVTGYKFTYEGTDFVASVWDPNKRYDDLKVMSLAEKDHYKPFPGYKFLDSEKSLQVVWKPGLVNSDNPRLVAGLKEGTWKVSSQPQRRSEDVPWVVKRITERAINHLL